MGKCMTIRSLAKKIIAYTIEDEYKVYRLRKTKLCVRIRYTKQYHRQFDDMPVSPVNIGFDNYMGNGYGCNPKYGNAAGACKGSGSCLDHEDTGADKTVTAGQSADRFI